MADALGKARNPFIDGFYVIISSLNNVLKLRHSAQHTVGPKASHILAYAGQLVLEKGMEEGGEAGCNTHIYGL